MRHLVVPAVAVVALALAASGSASPAMTVRAEGERSADGSATKVLRIPRGHNRLRIVYDAMQTVRPYTRDADYNRVYGPEITRPVPTADGNITLECRKSARVPWYSTTTTRRTFLAGTTTMRLSVRPAFQCRVYLSVSDYVTAFPDNDEENVALRLTASVTTLR
jgi:hypothetical protein